MTIETVTRGETWKNEDIRVLCDLNEAINRIPGSTFILTGSYGIEAVTGISIFFHNDIDTNVFVPNLPCGLEKIKSLLDKTPQFSLLKATDERLEYQTGSRNRRVEMKLMEIVGERKEMNEVVFIVRNGEGVFEVPITIGVIMDTLDNRYKFRVKTLDFQVATWALRVSGMATSPQREVRVSDLENFKVLLAGHYNIERVYRFIQNHPQNRNRFPGNVIFARALQCLQGEFSS